MDRSASLAPHEGNCGSTLSVLVSNRSSGFRIVLLAIPSRFTVRGGQWSSIAFVLGHSCGTAPASHRTSPLGTNAGLSNHGAHRKLADLGELASTRCAQRSPQPHFVAARSQRHACRTTTPSTGCESKACRLTAAQMLLRSRAAMCTKNTFQPNSSPLARSTRSPNLGTPWRSQMEWANGQQNKRCHPHRLQP